MESRPWRRKSVPPMPALIPISALRGGGNKSPCVDSVNDNNNGPSCQHLTDCGPCDRVNRTHHLELISDEEADLSGGDECDLGAAHQRCRRRSPESRVARRAIDPPASRDEQAPCVAPPRPPSAPALRPARTQRHRKSERRRREHRSSPHHRRSSTTTTITAAEDEQVDAAPSSDAKQPPRVNPIFVWVRQEDTRIVDVRCEDYDKRNRILLTKTAHGWRAIPRTETLTGTLEEKPARSAPADRHKHDRSKTGPGRAPKAKKSRRRRDSSDKHHLPESTESESHLSSTEPEVAVSESMDPESPWSRVSQDIESHLPSHTITIPKRHRTAASEETPALVVKEGQVCASPVPEVRSETEEVVSDSVNSERAHARVSSPESALDTLLAAAEIAFKNQIDEQSPDMEHLISDVDEMIADSVECDSREQSVLDNCGNMEINDCDYNEIDDDQHHFSHVLEKLEQSLQSPTTPEVETQPDGDTQDLEQESLCIEQVEGDLQTPEEYSELLDQETVEDPEMEDSKPVEEYMQEAENVVESIIDGEEMQETEQEYDVTEKEDNVDAQTDACEQPTDLTVMDGTEDDSQPTDLTTHSKQIEIDLTQTEVQDEPIVDDMQPTDLSFKKHSIPGLSIDPLCRPPSQNSETIQSPQPSGIPAVPPSPDIVTNTKQATAKSVFLESLLSTSPKISLNPELTITRNQKEPLDLGKGRKSASPTVSCSEEVKNIGEPLPKRIKMEDITLKNLLHADVKNAEVTIKPIPLEKKKPVIKDQSSRLLELLTSDSAPDPMTQLKQLLADPHINIPDPMLVPKDRLSHILAAPCKEIPRLLVTRPELRLPEALSHPTLMNDPDILVITMDQLHTILEKHHQPISLEESARNKTASPKEKPPLIEKADKQPPPPKSSPKPAKTASPPQISQQAIANDYHRYIQNLQHQQQLMLQEAQLKHHQTQMMRKPGLANDIDAATAASFNQMMWLPYLNQLEQAAQVTGNNQEFLKMLNAVFPNGGYPGPPEHVSPMFGPGRFGLSNAMPMQPPIDYNLEMAMWQEAMLRQKMPNPSESSMLAKQAAAYRENLEKRNHLMSANKNKSTFNMPGNMPHHLNGHSNGAPYLNGHQNSVLSNLQKQQMQRKPQGFSSARTNPIQHMSDQQLIGMKNPFFRPNMGMRPNIQVPNYNSLSQKLAPQKQKESHYLERHNPSQISLKNNPFFTPKEKSDMKFHKPGNRAQNCVQEFNPARNPGEPYNPIDLSGSGQPKLKVRSNLMSLEGGFGFGRGEEVAEVGSTTEDAMQNLHDSQTHHVWHPLFGK